MNTCKTCENQFDGDFCNRCGEKVVKSGDLTLKRILADLFNALTFADSKLWSTIKLIVSRPGQYSRNYIDGVRVKFMRPISLFFLANLLYFLFPAINTFTTALSIQLSSQGPHSKYATELVEDMLGKDNLNSEAYSLKLKDFSIRYNAKTTELSKLLLVLFAVLLSPFLWIIHLKKDKRIASYFIISLETMTFLLLCIQLFGLLFHGFSQFVSFAVREDTIITTVFLVSLIIFFFAVERNYFQNSFWKSSLNALLSSFSLAVCLFAYRILLFYVTIYSM